MTREKLEDHSFKMLANAVKERTNTPWEPKLLESFGLVTADGFLTNAGLLFSDDCDVFQSRVFCTKWNGLEKDDAINDSEYRGNLLYLLEMATSFVKANTAKRWYKLPSYRLNFPEYAERAIEETCINHLIHRDMAIIGSEVHIDIYDDRIEFYSPGGMMDGTRIQDQDYRNVASKRRNPILAEVFAQLDYMEKRGSGLKKIVNRTVGEMISLAHIPAKIHHKGERQHYDAIDIMGYTCLEDDVIFPSYSGNLAVGDIVEFRNAGGYSIVYKPPFICPQCAMYSMREDDSLTKIMREETFDDVFGKFLMPQSGMSHSGNQSRFLGNSSPFDR